ncbi:metacaspase-1 [Podospora didyma]|uniref:Metacaspase-1 n=1 Tax=Podospora didyma TaxID=330526 RepID=A0AAE0P3R6_9PEZI|nr:metacaspase-1 [Podospora didyma]
MSFPGQGYGPGGGHHQQHQQQPQYGGYQQQPQYPPQGQGGYGQHGGYPPQQQQGYAPPQQYQQQHQQYPPPQQYQQQQYQQPQQYQQQQHQQYQQQQQHQQYRPPAGAPPQHLDQYGYPIGQPQTHHRSAAPPPPSGSQQFGHGAPQQYTFAYSNCTGKRKALLIGINYFGQKGELRGCINDVQNVSQFLMANHGYKREDMVILTDDNQNQVFQPTKENILRAMDWLVKDAQPNDALFLHYSGHGGQTKDLDGDEEDGNDEVIYPVDFKTNGHIVDDDIHAHVVTPLKAGVRLTAIFDSCHSGSVLDLPYLYSTKGVLKEPNLLQEAGQGLFSAIGAYARGDVGGAASSIFSFAKSAMTGNEAHEKTKRTKTSPADVIMWSGSKDDQTSADATIGGKATGAMSHAFISALTADPQQSYKELLNSVRDILETKYEQKPQLSCSHPLGESFSFLSHMA